MWIISVPDEDYASNTWIKSVLDEDYASNTWNMSVLDEDYDILLVSPSSGTILIHMLQA
jgi:hypothetical protein